jgi:hypothetical protein
MLMQQAAPKSAFAMMYARAIPDPKLIRDLLWSFWAAAAAIVLIIIHGTWLKQKHLVLLEWACLLTFSTGNSRCLGLSAV